MKTKHKNIFKSLLALTLAFIMALGAAPLSALAGVDFASLFAPKAEATEAEHKVGDIVSFGSYPQSRVTDSATVSALDKISKNWVSYGYYSGDGSYSDSMVQGDWMKYADITYNGAKYRAVFFTQYRPWYTGYTSSSGNTYQDDNGYTPNNIYYFKYEPLKWRLLDPATGLVLCENIIDSQAYSNTIYQYGTDPYHDNWSAYWNDAEHTHYANDYATSSIRKWLNDDFYNTAFSASQKANILTSELDNRAYSTSYSKFDSETTYDKVFLLSWSEMQNTAYGFPANTNSSSARQAKGTDYAKCQGLWANSSNECSHRRLRSAGGDSDSTCYVDSDGDLGSYWYVDGTDYGVRPALKISNLASGIFESKIKNLSSDEYAIFVTDSNGAPLAGAEVSWNSEKKTSDAEGMAAFKKLTAGEPRIIIKKSGYLTYDSKGTGYSKSSGGYDVFCLYKEGSEEIYKLASAIYSGSALTQDILYGTKRLSLSSPNAAFKIFCTANVPGEVKEYRLVQGKKTIAKSSDGNFSLKIGSFSEGGGVKVEVIGKDGTRVDTRLNLSFTDDKSVDSTSISLGKNFSLKLSSDIPYVGGSEINIALPSLPVDVYVDDDGDGGGKVSVGLNADLYAGKKTSDGSWEKSADGKKTIDTQVKNIKDTMKTLKKYSSGVQKYLSEKDKKALKSLMKKNSKSDIPGLNGVDISFIGYGEGAWSKNGFTTVTVNLYIIADVKGYSMTQQFLVWVVPFVVTIDAGLKVTCAAQAEYDFQKQTISGDVALTLSPNLKAFGGLGIGKAVGVGAYGNATLDVEMQIIGTTYPTGLKKIDLTGDMGIKAYFTVFEYKKSFAYKTWHLYTGSKKASPMLRAPAANGAGDMYDPSSYGVQDVSYLSGESEWLSGGRSFRAKAARASSAGAAEITPLMTQTYRNSQPQIVSTPETTLMAYIGADTSRGSANVTRIMYTIYDKEQGIWSSPRQLDANETADSMPYLYSDGTDIYIIYLDSSKAFTSDVTVGEYASSQNIAVAKFNKSAGGFDAPEVIGQCGGKYISTVPTITKSGSGVTAAWQLNGSDPFGANADNEIMYATFDGSSWSDAKQAASGLNAVVNLAADSSGIYYVCDSDNDLNTVDDRTLVKTSAAGGAKTLDSGTVSNPQSYGGVLYWYSNGTYKTYDGQAVADMIPGSIPGATDRFNVVGDKLLFLSATDTGSDIYVICRDEKTGSYTDPVKYTEQEKYIDTFSAAEVNGQIMAVMTRRDVTITEDNVDDECELAYTVLKDRHDIAVRTVEYDSDKVAPGETLPLTVEIYNAGTKNVTSVDLSVSDSSGSVLNGTYDVSIAPGETAQLTVDVTMKNKISLDTYTVTVKETGSSDANPKDNSSSVKIGYCKFDVSATPVVIGDKYYIIIKATNDSNVASGGSLNIKNSYSDENITVVPFDTLEPGESVIYKLEVDEELLGGRENVITVTASSDAEQDDLYSHTENIYCDLDEFDPPETTGITVEAPEKSIPVGGSYQLVAAAEPDGALLPDLVWTSSDPSVATVDENGLVTALSEGVTTVSVTDAESNFYTEVQIGVVQVIDFGDGITVKVGEKIIYTPMIAEGYVDYRYTWSSSDTSVVTVDPDLGELTGVKKGSATVTMNLVDENGNVVASNSFVVNVKSESIFKKILNVILAPFRAIINLFKKLFGK